MRERNNYTEGNLRRSNAGKEKHKNSSSGLRRRRRKNNATQRRLRFCFHFTQPSSKMAPEPRVFAVQTRAGVSDRLLPHHSFLLPNLWSNRFYVSRSYASQNSRRIGQVTSHTWLYFVLKFDDYLKRCHPVAECLSCLNLVSYRVFLVKGI